MEVILYYIRRPYPLVPRSIANSVTKNEVNVSGTLKVLDATKDVRMKKFVFASSSSIYDVIVKLPKTENISSQPLSTNVVSKLT